MYSQAEKLNEGDDVLFSSKFFVDSDRGIQEQSFTKEERVTDSVLLFLARSKSLKNDENDG